MPSVSSLVSSGVGRRDGWHFRLLQCCVLLTFHVVQNQNAVDHYECQNDQISFYVIHLILVEVQTKADYMPAVPTQTFLGVRHAFLPHKRLLNRKINSFPIVRKYQPEITCRLSEIQSALFKLKCWQAKHIRTSSVERDTRPKIFVADENLGYKLWVFVHFSL